MARLALTLPPSPLEPPTSYLSRLAARNHCESLMSFCLDVGIDLAALSTGSPEAVADIIELVGIQRTAFANTTIIKTSTMRYRVGREAMDTHTLSRGEIRVCHACIRDDLAGGGEVWSGIHRLHWQIPQVLRCVEHGVALTTHRPEVQGYSRLDVTSYLRSNINEIRKGHPNNAAATAADEVDRYLGSRIYGEHEPNWCDNLEIPALCKASVALGTLLEHGKNARASRLDAKAQRRAFLTGFVVLRGGACAITDALSEFTKRERKQIANQPSPQYGELQRMLGSNGKHRKDLDPLRDILRSYFVETYPIKPGTLVLGRKLPERRLHSLRSAYVEIGCRRAVLEEMLLARGIGKRSVEGHFRVDEPIKAETVAELKREKALYLNEAETADHLGASFNMFNQLHRSGLLEPRTGPLKRKHKGFDRRKLDSFLARIFERTEYCPTRPQGTVDVALATRKAKCSTPDILRLILEGKIKAAGRLTERYELRGLLVRGDDVSAALAVGSSNGLPFGQVCRRLYLDMKTLKCLIDADYLVAERRKRTTTRVTNTLVTEQSFEEFRAAYCAIGLLRKHRAGLGALQHGDLAALGIIPIDLNQDVRKIYRIADLPDDLPRLLPARRTKGRNSTTKAETRSAEVDHPRSSRGAG